MRIAFFTEAYDPFLNGVIVLEKSFRRQLEDMGHEVFIFTTSYAGRQDDDDRVVRLPSVAVSRRAYPCLLPLPTVFREIERRRIELVHSHHPFSTGVAAEMVASRLGLPHVYTLHSILSLYSRHIAVVGALAAPVMDRVATRHCERADCVTVTAGQTAEWLRRKGVRSAVQVVAPAVACVAVSDGERERVRLQHGLPAGVPVVIYAGRLSPEKNLDLLLKAAALLALRLDFRLLIVGSGSSEAHLRRLVSRLGLSALVTFTGEIRHESIAGYYVAADVFAFPSPNDTLGLVLLEAMAAGLPCVAVGVNGPRAVIRDGVDGILTVPSAPEFASALESMITDDSLRLRMGAAALASPHLVSADEMGQQLVEAYEAAFRARSGLAPGRLVARGY